MLEQAARKAANSAALSADEPSDRQLLLQFQEGSQEAATSLYSRYAHRLRAFVRRDTIASVGSCFDAEDIVQSVFRRFFKRASQGNYEVPASEELWNLFLVIALNRLRAEEAYHRAAKRDASPDRADAEPRQSGRSPRTAGPGDRVSNVVIDEALEHLPALQKQVVKLRIEGYEVAEIAEKIGRAKRTVERALQESRKQLSVLLLDQV